MANEIDIKVGNLSFDSNITIGAITEKEVKSVKIHDIPKSDGSIDEEAKRKNITIMVKGDVRGADYDAVRTNLDILSAAFHSGKQKFTKDDDRYIMAQLKSFDKIFPNAMRVLVKFQASFIASYPFWLSETEQSDSRTPSSGVGYIITNNGNAPTRVKITITAPGGGITDDIQIDNTTTGEQFKYRGTVAAGDDLEVDNRHDTDEFEVLNNGVDDHVNFEGDFLTLNPGANTIVFTGTVGVTVIKHRDAWY